MHQFKFQALVLAHNEWKAQKIPPKTHPKIVILGHGGARNLQRLRLIQSTIASRFDNPDFVRVETPTKNTNMDALDAANILVCILSNKFVESEYCMNALNVGILRNRSEGGYLIPIALGELSCDCTPSFVRLMPTLDATSWTLEEAKFVLEQLLPAAANLSASRCGWNDYTTLVPYVEHQPTWLQDSSAFWHHLIESV